MSSFGKFGFALAAALLMCGAAVPASHAQSRSLPYVVQMNSSGSYLGIQMDDVTASNMAKYKLSSEKGVIVRSVQKGSPAEDAKIQEGDVILDYGGLPVWSAAQFARMVEETPAGRKVEMVVSRDGKRTNLTAEIGTRTRSDRSLNDRNMFPRDFMERIFPDIPGSGAREDRLNEPERKPRLGVTLQPLTEQLGEYLGVPGKKGALISSVLQGSAGAGKLKSGDVVTHADGKEINDPEDLIRVVSEKTAGSLTLKVVREKKEITVVVNLPAPEEVDGKGIKL